MLAFEVVKAKTFSRGGIASCIIFAPALLLTIESVSVWRTPSLANITGEPSGAVAFTGQGITARVLLAVTHIALKGG